jgi:hypothetical protein
MYINISVLLKSGLDFSDLFFFSGNFTKGESVSYR